MTDEQLKSRHEQQVEAIKAIIKRKNDAPKKMLKALKAALAHIDGSPSPETRTIIVDAIAAAEERDG